MKTNSEPIVVELFFEIAQEKIWNAITDSSEMKQWYFENIPDFKPEVGFTTQFIVHTEERTFPHCWKVTEVQNKKRIAYQWTFEGYKGKGVSTFEISSVNHQSKLHFSFETLESFPKDIPEFKRESGVAGWDYFLKDRLTSYLNQG